MGTQLKFGSDDNLVVAGHQDKAPAVSNLLNQGNNRRALGDIGNLPGVVSSGSNARIKDKVDYSKTHASRKLGTEGMVARTQPTAGIRTRAQTAAAAAEQQATSLSSLLQARSEAAVAHLRPPLSPVPDIDSSDRHNPLMATDYVNDIYSYYKKVESKFRVSPDYMVGQMDINEKMRSILVDWLVEVHLKFKLMPETLFLTVNLVDRFLEAKPVPRKTLQLVGVTAMLIASKYEEIWAPEVWDFVCICDKTYTREEILSMEKAMLSTLRFNLTLPTCYNFLARFLKAAGSHMDKQVSIEPLVRQLVDLMKKAGNASTLNAVFKKYSQSKYLEVAKTGLPNMA